ncbi:divergent polysaccharide deacetylase family protein, partial [bacterium]|nr:divergent polysaccharide deacetylase family protein [bacterium]
VSEARRAGVPVTRNRMFIDSPVDESGRIDVQSQLDQLVELARKRGEAVGLGHPHAETLRVLRKALPELESEGIDLVFISELVE